MIHAMADGSIQDDAGRFPVAVVAVVRKLLAEDDLPILAVPAADLRGLRDDLFHRNTWTHPMTGDIYWTARRQGLSILGPLTGYQAGIR